MRTVRTVARAPGAKGQDPGLNPSLGQGWGLSSTPSPSVFDGRRVWRWIGDAFRNPARKRCLFRSVQHLRRPRTKTDAAVGSHGRGRRCVDSRQAARRRRSLALEGWDEGVEGLTYHSGATAHLRRRQMLAPGSAARGLEHAVGSWNDAGSILLKT